MTAALEELKKACGKGTRGWQLQASGVLALPSAESSDQ